MSMKRWIFLPVILVLVLVMMLNVGFAAKKTVELTFWTFVAQHADFFKERVAAFNKSQSNVEVKLNAVNYPYQEMHDKLLIALQSGVGAPDIVDIEIGKFGNYLKGNIQLVPLNDILKNYKDQLIPERMNLYSYKGNQYGLDWHLGTFLMYYNKELLASVGVNPDKINTWNDYIEAGKKVTKDTNGDGKIDQWMTTVGAIDAFNFAALSQQNGGGIYDENGRMILDCKENIQALQMLADWVNKHKITTFAPNGLQDEASNWRLINQGRIASIMMPQWFMTRFTDSMPDLKGKIVIRPMPAWHEGGSRATMGGGTGTAITNQIAKNKLAVAKELLEFAKLTRDAQIKIWTDLGFDPYRYDVFADPLLQKPNPYFSNESVFATIQSVSDKMEPQYIGPFFADAWQITCESVVYGVTEKGEDPAILLKAAAKRVRELK